MVCRHWFCASGFTFVYSIVGLAEGVTHIAEQHAAVEVSGTGPLHWSSSRTSQSGGSRTSQSGEALLRRDGGHARSVDDDGGEIVAFPGTPAPKRQTRLKVPGHFALGTLEEDMSEVMSQPDCAAAFSKALQLIAQTIKLSGDSKPLEDLKNKLVADESSPSHDDARLMERFLNNATASGVAAAAWSETDQSDFICCTSGRGNNGTCPQLEESTEVPGCSTCTVAEGDIIEEGNGTITNVLLEAAIKGARWGGDLWPITSTTTGVHEITYCYATTITTAARDAFDAAVNHIEQQVPCLKFQAKTASACANAYGSAVQECCTDASGTVIAPSIIVQSTASSCLSMIGRSSGTGTYITSSQPLILGQGCEVLGIAAHEIGHALGMLHEMARSDRETYVTIHRDNIQVDKLSNFENNTNAFIGTDFDFLSLMMYAAWTFTDNGNITIMPHDKRLVPIMGQRMGFSELDIDHLGTMYGCVDTVNPLTRNKALSQGYLQGNGFEAYQGPCEDQAITGFLKKDGSNYPCSELRQHCRHVTQGEGVRNKCPASCFVCIPGLGNYQANHTDRTAAKHTARIHGLPLFIAALLTNTLAAATQ